MVRLAGGLRVGIGLFFILYLISCLVLSTVLGLPYLGPTKKYKFCNGSYPKGGQGLVG